jgi:hypothetical protein
MSRRSWLLGLCALSCTLLVPAAGAHAACYGATPASAWFADSPIDGTSGLAPEITTVTASLDGACNYAVDPGLAPLIEGDAAFIYVDRDGNPATGSPTPQGADVVVGTLGYSGADSPPLLGTWDGSAFQFSDPSPVGSAPANGGFSANVDRLGIPSGVTTRFAVGTIWQGVYYDYVDFAPEPGAPGIPLGVSYSTTPSPPPAPPPPAVPVSTAPAQAQPVPATGHSSAACTVPKVSGRTRAAASDRLWDAGCDEALTVSREYSRTMRQGRVIRTTPAAGSWTTKHVRLVVSKGRRPHRGARAAAAEAHPATVLERLQELANAPLR